MKMLDLFCGEGLAAWGYWQSARFSEIVGVDIDDHARRYAFDFIQGDALALDYEFLMEFDFIHASPPCQAYSKVTPDRSRHPRLIPGTHLMLQAAGVPYVIENVEGSGRELRPTHRLTGYDVGLPHSRPRYFHISTRQSLNLSNVAQVKMSSAAQVHGRQYMRRDALIRAMGLDCIPLARRSMLTMAGIEQGVPPAMTRLIAESMFPHKFRID